MSRWIVLALAVALFSPAIARAGDPEVEARLRALEEANRKLAEQCAALLKRDAENRKVADERYKDLEQRYEELRSKVGSTPEAPPPPEASEPKRGGPEKLKGLSNAPGPVELGSAAAEDVASSGRHLPRIPLDATFHDGFELATEDDELSLRFHVLSQTDFKDFIPNTQSPARSGLYIPRVRVYFEGDATRLFDYEVSLQRSVEGTWDLLDANIDYKPSEKFQIRFGRMLVPYSYDWYDHLEQYFITPERGLFPLNFGLSRAAGLLAQGWLFDQRLQYAVGGFDGRLTGIADNNNTRDAVGYINARPFLRSERFPALKFLNVGGSIFGGEQILPQDPLPLRTSIQSSENDEAAANASAVFMTFNPGVTNLGSRFADALHVAWYRRSLSFEAEWQEGRFDFAKEHEHGRVSVPVKGSHIGFGYFITGEQVESRATVVPLRPFNPKRGERGPGAIELFARFSRIELGRNVFTEGLADPSHWTRTVNMTDVGFNWYPNRFLKFYVDWQLPVYGSPVITDPATGRSTKTGNMFWIRCQVYF